MIPCSILNAMCPRSVSVWRPAWELSSSQAEQRASVLRCLTAEIMIHQPSGGAQGQATEIQIAAQHILKTKETLNRILAENTGQPLEVI